MATFVFDRARGCMVDKATGEPMNQGPWKPVTPMTFGDIEPYQSPVTGEYVSGRRAKRDDLEKHGCIDAAEFGRKPRKLKNKRFIEKHGLQRFAE